MGEFPNEILIDHTKQIAELKTDVDNLKDRVNDLSDIKEAVIKLTVLQEKQTEFSEEFSQTLKTMNVKIDNTNNKVDKLETKFEEKIIEIDNKSKVDLLKVAKDWTPKLILGGIAYYILQLVGIIAK